MKYGWRCGFFLNFSSHYLLKSCELTFLVPEEISITQTFILIIISWWNLDSHKFLSPPTPSSSRYQYRVIYLREIPSITKNFSIKTSINTLSVVVFRCSCCCHFPQFSLTSKCLLLLSERVSRRAYTLPSAIKNFFFSHSKSFQIVTNNQLPSHNFF